MKKAILYFILFVAAINFVGFCERHYTIEGKVVGETRIEDETGQFWTYEDLPYKIETPVRIYFYDNGTMDYREDDKILKVNLDLDTDKE